MIGRIKTPKFSQKILQSDFSLPLKVEVRNSLNRKEKFQEIVLKNKPEIFVRKKPNILTGRNVPTKNQEKLENIQENLINNEDYGIPGVIVENKGQRLEIVENEYHVPDSSFKNENVIKVEEEESLSSKMVIENDPLLNDSENHAGKQISSDDQNFKFTKSLFFYFLLI